MRSIAGSVAPIAAVAGSNSRNVPKNATDHCHAGAGCTPVNRSAQALNGGIATISSRLHSAMASSHPAYQRTGRALLLDARAERERADRQPAEERRHHRQHGGRLVTQPQRALLRPDDLVAQPGKAGGHHQAAATPACAARAAPPLNST